MVHEAGAARHLPGCIDRRYVEEATSAPLSLPAKCSSNSPTAATRRVLIVTYLTRADDAASSQTLPAVAAAAFAALSVTQPPPGPTGSTSSSS